MNAVNPVLTPLALQNAALLARLASGEPFASLTDLAREVGIDRSNLNRKLAALEGEGLVERLPLAEIANVQASEGLKLTAAGFDAHYAAVRANSPAPAEAPAGFVALTAADIAFDAGNARTVSGLSPLEIEEMAASIREHGLLTPPIVRRVEQGPGEPPDYILVAGERRLRGWQLAIERDWLHEDTVFLCQIFAGDDVEATEAALVENIQRVDLDNLEAAEGIRKLALKSDPPASPDDIARRLGKTTESGKRWVQERYKVAFEATPENKARYRAHMALRARLGDDYKIIDDPDRYRWTDLRDSVKTPRHVTALEKNPALAMLVVELATISDCATDLWDEPVAYRTGTDTALIEQAIGLGLVEMVSIDVGWGLAVTQLACDWLAGQSFGEDAEAAADLLARVRVAALGPVGAATFEGRWATEALNLPSPPLAPAAAGTDNPDAGPTLRPGLTGDDFSRQLRASLAADGEEGAVPPASEVPTASDGTAPEPSPIPAASPPPGEPQAGPGGIPPAAGATPPPIASTSPLDALSPLARLALLEVAWIIADRPMHTRGGVIAGAPVWDFQLDPSGTWQALRQAQMINVAQRADGTGYLATLSPLAERALARYPTAGYRMDAVMSVRGEYLFRPVSGQTYVAPWLNPPTKAAEPEPRSATVDHIVAANEQPYPAAKPAAEQPPGDIIVRQMREALTALSASARAASVILKDLDDGSDQDVAKTLTALDEALTAASPYLPKGSRK